MPRPALSSPAHPVARLLHDLRTWPRTSQEQARRNAMVAATDCARRRAERQEVDDYLTRTSPPVESAVSVGSVRTSGATAHHNS